MTIILALDVVRCKSVAEEPATAEADFATRTTCRGNL